MAPIKFEEDIKKRMEQREIQPSEEAWSKLSSALDDGQKRKPKPFIWFMGIAASVMGLLLVSALVFKASEGLPMRQNTVATGAAESKSNPTNSEAESEQAKKMELNSILETQTNVSEVTESKKSNSNSDKRTTKDYTQKPVRQPSEEKLAATGNYAQNDKNNTSHLNKAMEERILEVVAELKKLETEAGQPIEDEIESLLKQAEKDIIKQRLYTGNITVNAQSLLQDVEADLEHSFRSKVFEALKSSYETVRTAVAERNN